MYLTVFFVRTTLIYAVVTRPYGVAMSIDVVLDVTTDQTSVTLAVNRAMDSFSTLTSSRNHEVTVEWIPLHATSPGHATTTVWNRLNAGIHGIITVLRCSQTKAVSAIAAISRTPHLSVSLDPCPPSDLGDFTVHVTTEHTAKTPVLVDILRTAGRTRIGLYVYTRAGQTVQQDLLLQLSSAGISTVLLSWPKHTPVTCPETAGVVVLITNYSPWSLIADRKLACTGLTWVVIADDVTWSATRQLSKDSNHGDMLLVKARPGVSCPQDGRFVARLCELQICIAEKFCDDSGPTGQMEYDLYGGPLGSHGRFSLLGEWTESTGLSLFHNSFFRRLFSDTRSDFGGVTLRVVVNDYNAPFVSLTGNRSHHGLVIDMMKELSDILNFKYTLIHSDDGLFGTKLSDGSWSGLIGMVARREADLGAGSIGLRGDRAQVVDFTTPYLQDSLGIITQVERRKVPGQFQIFKTFSAAIWWSVVASVVTVCGLSAVIGVTSTRMANSNDPDVLCERSVIGNIFLVISSYLQQGPTFHPRSVSGRSLLAFWLVFTLMTSAMYTADLAAVLTVSSPDRPIDSIKDLNEQTDVQINVRQGSFISDFFYSSTSSEYQSIAARMKPSLNPVEDLLTGVSSGRVCAIENVMDLSFAAGQSCGKLRVAQERFHGMSMALIFPRQSPYKGAVDSVIQKMVESGLVDKLTSKWLSPPTDCPVAESTGEVRQLGMGTLAGVFIVYGFVTLLAVCLLLLELGTRRGLRCPVFR